MPKCQLCSYLSQYFDSICEKVGILKRKLTPLDSDTVSFFILFFEFNTILRLQDDFRTDHRRLGYDLGRKIHV